VKEKLGKLDRKRKIESVRESIAREKEKEVKREKGKNRP
jgi:hypothetical protein